MKKTEFIEVFQLSRTKLFEVHYYTLSSNKLPHFATSAEEFCRSKADYVRAGQCQNDICRGFPSALAFFRKWDHKHLQDLAAGEYEELYKDLTILESKYNYMKTELDETCRPYNPSFGFHSLVQFSKQPPKMQEV